MNTAKTVSCKITRLLYAFRVALDGADVVVGSLLVTGETVLPVGAAVTGGGVNVVVSISGSFSPYCDAHWLIPSE